MFSNFLLYEVKNALLRRTFVRLIKACKKASLSGMAGIYRLTTDALATATSNRIEQMNTRIRGKSPTALAIAICESVRNLVCLCCFR